MQQEEGNFSGAGGLRIYYRYWRPEASVRAVILVVHGAGEHCVRYTRFAEWFTGKGYALAALDETFDHPED